MGHAADLVLSSVELLLEGDVGGGEALVVGEEALDLLVLGGEAFLDDGRVRGMATAEAEGGAVSHLLEEGGVVDRAAPPAAERGRRHIVERRRRALHAVRRHTAPPRHRRRNPSFRYGDSRVFRAQREMRRRSDRKPVVTSFSPGLETSLRCGILTLSDLKACIHYTGRIALDGSWERCVGHGLLNAIIPVKRYRI